MPSDISVDSYLGGLETTKRMELVYGVVREPPAPLFHHQLVVTRVGSLLYQHVRDRQLGEVCVSPIDVILDRDEALVLQPDVIFVSAARRHIVSSGRIWGAPDLVVEVLSLGTAARDRHEKLAWYRQYGVRECWLVDPPSYAVEVVDCSSPQATPARRLVGDAIVQSVVLPEFQVSARELVE